MKTLIVKYLPSGEKSNTKKVLDLFITEASQQKNNEIETIDLLESKMPMFDAQSIQAYYKRNYGGQVLDQKEAALLAQHDQLTKQFKSADIFVMAFPMHNFGMPAPAKAYLDAVVMKGETFDYGEKKMAGKKGLMLFTSGGVYSENIFNLDYPNWNSIALLAKANFNFMGFDEGEVIGTSLRGDEVQQNVNLNEVKQKVQNLVKTWYR